MRRYKRLRIKEMKISANGRQDLGSDESCISLARSWLSKPINPLITHLHTREILDGNRRVHGCNLLGEGEREVDVIETDEEVTPESLVEYGLLTSLHTKPLTDFEKASAMLAIKKSHDGMTDKQIAQELLNVDPGTFSRYCSLERCVPLVIDAAKAGRIGVSAWYEVSKLPHDEQPEALALALRGANREELTRHVKRQRNGDQPTVRMKRVVCPLPGGKSVTVAGEDLSISALIEVCETVLKAAKKAEADGWDIKSFARVLANKAK